MRHALLVCIKDLRQRMRDRTAILTAIVAPLVVTALMGLALGGSQGGSGMRLCIADLDRSKLSPGFVDFVERPALGGLIRVEPVCVELQFRRQLGSEINHGSVVASDVT